jgi:choline dehydrogenase-like flavoprotein
MLLTASDDLSALSNPDVVVVGAGAVGLTVALLLSRAGKRVVVLEAGKANPRSDYREENRGPNLGVHYDGIARGRVRALGGTTRLWGGQLVPFLPEDFGVRGERPAWPVTYDEVEPWYREAIRFLKLKQDWDPVQGVRQDGDAGQPYAGDRFEVGTHIWLSEPDFSRLYADEIASNDVSIVLEAEVYNAEFEADGGVGRIWFKSSGGEKKSISAKTFVLATGTIEISRLLLNIRRLNPHSPISVLNFVGQNYIDHLHGVVGELRDANVEKVRKFFEVYRKDGVKYSTKLRWARGRLRESASANCASTLISSLTIRSAVSDLRDLLGRFYTGRSLGDFWGRLKSSVSILSILAPTLLRYAMTRRSDTFLGREIKIALELEQLPCAESYVFLEEQSDGRDYPKAGISWGFDGRERAAAEAFCADLATFVEEEGLGRVEFGELFVEDDRAFFSRFHDSAHHIGGARMATRPEDGVVDRNLKVFGSSNLYLAGAATFPSGSFANPTLTALAFAHRLAAEIGHACSGEQK